MDLPLPALVVLVALALMGLLTLWTTLVRRRLRLPSEADELHFVQTADGWRVAVLRLRPLAGPHRRVPVVLCHGLWANRYNVHFDQKLSLGRYLAERGHDVFLVELRGSGLSSRPPAVAPGWRAGEFGFDEHVFLDATAALERVREVTGAERVFWVGHSMGGMVAYALVGTEHARHLAGFVAVGSPAQWDHLPRRLKRLLRLGRRLVRRGVRIRWVAGLAAPFFGWIHPPGGYLALNPKNMDGRVIRRAIYNLIGDLSAGHVAQFGAWIEHGRFTSRDGRTDYAAGLREARVPAYLIAGAVDGLAAPAAVRAAYELLGSEDKRFEILGRETGCAVDYGHGDLLLGRRSREEVFPRIADWLEAHEGS